MYILYVMKLNINKSTKEGNYLSRFTLITQSSTVNNLINYKIAPHLVCCDSP